MNDFYKVIPGSFEGIKTNSTFNLDSNKIIRILLRTIIVVIAFFCTNWVFKICIIQNTLQNTITLGSIFATLGSAIVAIASLYCNDCYTRFSDNVLVLQEELLQNEKWTRWTFIKRKSKRRLLDNGNLVKVLQNAQIEFQLGSHSIKIFIPTVRADFDDLPILSHFLLMKKYSKQYETHLCNHAERTDTKAFFIWDCIFDIYAQIVYYKFFTYIIWIGCSFICVSILFSFLYIYI